MCWGLWYINTNTCKRGIYGKFENGLIPVAESDEWRSGCWSLSSLFDFKREYGVGCHYWWVGCHGRNHYRWTGHPLPILLKEGHSTDTVICKLYHTGRLWMNFWVTNQKPAYQILKDHSIVTISCFKSDRPSSCLYLFMKFKIISINVCLRETQGHNELRRSPSCGQTKF